IPQPNSLMPTNRALCCASQTYPYDKAGDEDASHPGCLGIREDKDDRSIKYNGQEKDDLYLQQDTVRFSTSPKRQYM
ncbi:MAG TPA: hypothetical protein VGM31_15260, partial [Puia sp.]